MGGYDLMWNDGPVYREDANLQTFGSSGFTANTHLGRLNVLLLGSFFSFSFRGYSNSHSKNLFFVAGCVNDREKQLRQLLKPFPCQRKA